MSQRPFPPRGPHLTTVVTRTQPGQGALADYPLLDADLEVSTRSLAAQVPVIHAMNKTIRHAELVHAVRKSFNGVDFFLN